MASTPDPARGLLADCELYLEQKLELVRFQARLGQANLALNYEEKELRKKLRQAGGQLDSIRFRFPLKEVFDQTVPVVKKLRDALAAHLA